MMAAQVKRRLTAGGSIAWDHFKMSVDNLTVQCSICKKSLAYNRNTTAMLDHLKRKHPHVCMKKTDTEDGNVTASTVSLSGTTVALPVQRSIASFMTANRPCTVERSNIITEHIFNIIARGMRPINFVEDNDFCALMKYVEPSYKLPGRTCFTTMIESTYQRVQITLKQLLANADSVALTTDLWTSTATEAYITVTAHFITSDWTLKSQVLGNINVNEKHTSDNIKQWIYELVIKFMPVTKVR